MKILLYEYLTQILQMKLTQITAATGIWLSLLIKRMLSSRHKLLFIKRMHVLNRHGVL